MPFDVAQLQATISVDTRDAERDLQRFSQWLSGSGRKDTVEAERGLFRVEDKARALDSGHFKGVTDLIDIASKADSATFGVNQAAQSFIGLAKVVSMPAANMEQAQIAFEGLL
jgi:hypothetical protein